MIRAFQLFDQRLPIGLLFFVAPWVDLVQRRSGLILHIKVGVLDRLFQCRNCRLRGRTNQRQLKSGIAAIRGDLCGQCADQNRDCLVRLMADPVNGQGGVDPDCVGAIGQSSSQCGQRHAESLVAVAELPGGMGTHPIVRRIERGNQCSPRFLVMLSNCDHPDGRQCGHPQVAIGLPHGPGQGRHDVSERRLGVG